MDETLSALFRYQAWANAAVLEALAAVDPAAHPAEHRKAVRLMNHIHVVAEIFAAHLRGVPHGHTSDNTAETPDIGDLAAAVAALDAWYRTFSDNATPEALSEAIAFSFTDGDRGRMTRREMLSHVALHGGYHRGEVGRILAEIGAGMPRDTFAAFLHGAEPGRRAA